MTGKMAPFTTEALTGDVQGVLFSPTTPSGLGVIVLNGSSGKIDPGRAQLFAARGAHALALQWFAGPGQIPGVCEVPVEGFSQAIDRLVAIGCSRIALVGTSKGAEGALLAAVHDARIDVVVAISPSHVAWANSGVGRDGIGWPLRSSWTAGAKPIPFVPYDVARMPPQGEGPVAYLAYHHASLETFAADVPAATIPIEQSRAHVVLVAGGDDALWPSAMSAEILAARLKRAGKPVDLLIDAEAGHRLLLPGETTPRSTINLHGGTDQADVRLGRHAWNVICNALRLSDAV